MCPCNMVPSFIVSQHTVTYFEKTPSKSVGDVVSSVSAIDFWIPSSPVDFPSHFAASEPNSLPKKEVEQTRNYLTIHTHIHIENPYSNTNRFYWLVVLVYMIDSRFVILCSAFRVLRVSRVIRFSGGFRWPF